MGRVSCDCAFFWTSTSPTSSDGDEAETGTLPLSAPHRPLKTSTASLAATAVEPGDDAYRSASSTYLRGGAPGLVLRPRTAAQVADDDVQLAVPAEPDHSAVVVAGRRLPLIPLTGRSRHPVVLEGPQADQVPVERQRVPVPDEPVHPVAEQRDGQDIAGVGPEGRLVRSLGGRWERAVARRRVGRLRACQPAVGGSVRQGTGA